MVNLHLPPLFITFSQTPLPKVIPLITFIMLFKEGYFINFILGFFHTCLWYVLDLFMFYRYTVYRQIPSPQVMHKICSHSNACIWKIASHLHILLELLFQLWIFNFWRKWTYFSMNNCFREDMVKLCSCICAYCHGPLLPEVKSSQLVFTLDFIVLKDFHKCANS